MIFEINQHRQNTIPPADSFVHGHGLVFCIGMNESQRWPQEVAAEASDFIVNVVHPKVMETTKHHDYILSMNMDQTPVPFMYNARKTLEIVGRCTVHIRKSTYNTKRATFAMTGTASGKVFENGDNF